MRQLQTEIERLKTDLRNFKIAINDIKITNKNVVQDVSGINRLIQNMRTRISSHGYINSLLDCTRVPFLVKVKAVNEASPYSMRPEGQRTQFQLNNHESVITRC